MTEGRAGIGTLGSRGSGSVGLSCWLSIQRAFKSSLILDKWPRMRPARLRSPCTVVSAIQFSHVAKTVAFWSLQAV